MAIQGKGNLRPASETVLESSGLDALIEVLKQKGYEVVGPAVRDGAIVYDTVASTKDLPAGWTDEQEAGTYRLKKREDSAFFGYAVGPHSWKKFLSPPSVLLWKAARTAQGFEISPETPPPPKFAFLGVRACELNAIAIQDKVFLGGEFVDLIYQERRKNIFIIAVNCSQAARTCFCVSMKTGPKAQNGFDLSLTEILEGEEPCFLVEAGSEKGRKILNGLPGRDVTPKFLEKANAVIEKTASQMVRSLNTEGIQELFYRNRENPRWQNVAERCLACANCTMVCPTCFCSTVEEVTDLTGDHAERWRKWDSCFTGDFSYIHGGRVRPSTLSRYRQWITHKLATWQDQFGTSGCVGCGRCIAWCPAGIDITEEARQIRKSDGKREEKKS